MAKATNDNELKCEACKSPYFEVVRAERFDKTAMVVISQPPAPISGMAYILLRCIRCGELHEPNVQLALADRLRKEYDHFLDTMEEKDKLTTKNETT